LSSSPGVERRRGTVRFVHIQVFPSFHGGADDSNLRFSFPLFFQTFYQTLGAAAYAYVGGSVSCFTDSNIWKMGVQVHVRCPLGVTVYAKKRRPSKPHTFYFVFLAGTGP
jgi:hypothetical protein